LVKPYTSPLLPRKNELHPHITSIFNKPVVDNCAQVEVIPQYKGLGMCVGRRPTHTPQFPLPVGTNCPNVITLANRLGML
jgi:hypothetical protein